MVGFHNLKFYFLLYLEYARIYFLKILWIYLNYKIFWISYFFFFFLLLLEIRGVTFFDFFWYRWPLPINKNSIHYFFLHFCSSYYKLSDLSHLLTITLKFKDSFLSFWHSQYHLYIFHYLRTRNLLLKIYFFLN